MYSINININVYDELVNKIGSNAIKNYIQEQIEILQKIELSDYKKITKKENIDVKEYKGLLKISKEDIDLGLNDLRSEWDRCIYS